MSATTLDNGLMKRMIQSVLDLKTQKEGPAAQAQAMAALRLGDCSVCDRLRYSLAQEIAKYLGTVDSTLKSVYIYEPEYAVGEGAIPDSSPSSPGIHMIAWVARKSAALSSVVNILGSSLIEEFRTLGCPKANALCHGLAVQVVDDGEVLRRTGYGALVNSIYVRPIQLWSRDALVP